MRQTNTMLLLILGVLLVSLATSCSDNDNPVGNTTEELHLINIYPEPGATQVSPGVTVSMKFGEPMDTASLHGGFYLSGGQEMHRWMDSLGHHQGMGGRGPQGMQHMYAWMDSIAYHGQFHWNEALDSCWFDPDSSLMPNTEHLILIEGTVHDRHGHVMDHHGTGEFFDYRFTTGS